MYVHTELEDEKEKEEQNTNEREKKKKNSHTKNDYAFVLETERNTPIDVANTCDSVWNVLRERKSAPLNGIARDVIACARRRGCYLFTHFSNNFENDQWYIL